MDGLIGPIHDPALANGHHVKEHWSRGVFLTKKTYQIYELGIFLHSNAQFIVYRFQ